MLLLDVLPAGISIAIACVPGETAPAAEVMAVSPENGVPLKYTDPSVFTDICVLDSLIVPEKTETAAERDSANVMYVTAVTDPRMLGQLYFGPTLYSVNTVV